MIHLKLFLIIVAHLKNIFWDIYFIKHKSLRNVTVSSILTYTDIFSLSTDSFDKYLLALM